MKMSWSYEQTLLYLYLPDYVSDIDKYHRADNMEPSAKCEWLKNSDEMNVLVL
jgi:hypothetical protein